MQSENRAPVLVIFLQPTSLLLCFFITTAQQNAVSTLLPYREPDLTTTASYVSGVIGMQSNKNQIHNLPSAIVTYRLAETNAI